MDQENNSLFNDLHPVVLGLAVVIFGLEVMFQLATAGLLGGSGGIGWRMAAVRDYGVFHEIAAWMFANNSYPANDLMRLVTYPLIHGGFIHAVFVSVFILAIGKMVSQVFSGLSILVLFFAGSIIGALAFVGLLNSTYPLIGGYPGVYALIGAFTFILWANMGRTGDNPMRAFSLIAMLLGIQILFAFLQGDWGSVVSDLSGFVTGLALSFVLIPGGWALLLQRLRKR